MSLTADVLAYAHRLGFDRAGILPIGPPARYVEFVAWLAAGYGGEMAYLAARAAERANPALIAPGARSMIVLAARYHAIPPPRCDRSPDRTTCVASAQSGDRPALGGIARYARSADYHDVLKPRLYDLDAFIRQRTGRTTLGKVCVDTAPLLERDFASQAGLGFIGRNTCLITPGLGSWTTLAVLLVPEELDTGRTANGERPMTNDQRSTPNDESAFVRGRPSFVGCGRCTRCLDACPTRALVAPYILDARRCIAYLTIELRGPISRDLRPLMGHWVFGCDVCQEVCPHNRATHVPGTSEGAWHVTNMDLPDLLTLDEAAFRARFRGTPMMRAKRHGLVRNACVAAGNSGDSTLVPALVVLLADAEPLVRGHAAWALGRLGGATAASALGHALAAECDAWVRDEIAFARSPLPKYT